MEGLGGWEVELVNGGAGRRSESEGERERMRRGG